MPSKVIPTTLSLSRYNSRVWTFELSGPIGDRFLHVTPLELMLMAKKIKSTISKIRRDKNNPSS